MSLALAASGTRPSIPHERIAHGKMPTLERPATVRAKRQGRGSPERENTVRQDQASVSSRAEPLKWSSLPPLEMDLPADCCFSRVVCRFIPSETHRRDSFGWTGFSQASEKNSERLDYVPE